MEPKAPKTSAQRLRQYANVNKLANLDYHARKMIAQDISQVLKEREAYRVYYWVMVLVVAGVAGIVGFQEITRMIGRG